MGVETGASKNEVTAADWHNVRRTSYMDATFDKLGWKVPDRAPFLPKDWGGVAIFLQTYAAELLDGRGPLRSPANSSGSGHSWERPIFHDNFADKIVGRRLDVQRIEISGRGRMMLRTERSPSRRASIATFCSAGSSTPCSRPDLQQVLNIFHAYGRIILLRYTEQKDRRVRRDPQEPDDGVARYL